MLPKANEARPKQIDVSPNYLSSFGKIKTENWKRCRIGGCGHNFEPVRLRASRPDAPAFGPVPKRRGWHPFHPMKNPFIFGNIAAWADEKGSLIFRKSALHFDYKSA